MILSMGIMDMIFVLVGVAVIHSRVVKKLLIDLENQIRREIRLW